jgi:hypothetical protein
MSGHPPRSALYAGLANACWQHYTDVHSLSTLQQTARCHMVVAIMRVCKPQTTESTWL